MHLYQIDYEDLRGFHNDFFSKIPMTDETTYRFGKIHLIITLTFDKIDLFPLP